MLKGRKAIDALRGTTLFVLKYFCQRIKKIRQLAPLKNI